MTKAVSYTHLISKLTALEEKMASGVEKLKADTATAVSYTHLDVYKRQE